MKTKTTPDIRFDEFDGDWKEERLGNVLKYEQPQAYIVENEKYTNKSRIPVLTAGQSFILGYTNETFGIKKASVDKPVIIFDDFTTSSHYVEFPFKVKSSAMKLLTPVNEKDNLYYYYNVINQLGYVPGNHERHWISNFSKMGVLMPTSHIEREKIANYIYAIDSQISEQRRKVEKLKDFKTALLDKMFPKDGETVPEIRFEGFTGEWERRRLGDVFDEYSDKNHVELFPLSVIQGKGTVLRSESERDLNYDSNSLSSYKMVKEGDFIVHLRSFEGGLEMATRTGIVSPAYHVLHGKNTDSYFYYIYFRSVDFIKNALAPHVYGIRDGKSIDINGMKGIKIPYPSLAEQRAIGQYFSTLDSLISTNQRKLEKLCDIKEALLNKMMI